MHTPKTFVLLLLPLLLCSCIPPQDVPIDQLGRTSSVGSANSRVSASASSGTRSSAPTAQTSSSPAITTGTGALAERLTDTGALELGDASAPLLLTAFINYSSSYSTDFLRDLLPRLEKDFVRTGALRIRLIVTPLKKYPNSAAEAAALRCGGTFGRGQLMNGALVAAKGRDRNAVLAIAKTLALPAKEFADCLPSAETKAALDAQSALIAKETITLVPTLMLNDEKKTGLPSYADLRGWIREKELSFE